MFGEKGRGLEVMKGEVIEEEVSEEGMITQTKKNKK